MFKQVKLMDPLRYILTFALFWFRMCLPTCLGIFFEHMIRSAVSMVRCPTWEEFFKLDWLYRALSTVSAEDLRFVRPLPATYMVIMWTMINRKSWTPTAVFVLVCSLYVAPSSRGNAHTFPDGLTLDPNVNMYG